MTVNTTVLVPVAAVVSSALLLIAGKKRVLEIIAVVASGLWLAIQLGVLNWPLRGVPQGLVIGGSLLVAGIGVYLSTSNKREVTASTVIAILGGVLVVNHLG
ncbi:MAG: hypothetical protein AB7P03_10905 [Kofleriaceae bacterium]